MKASGSNDPWLLKQLGVESFQQRLPWIGGDLQTLRDTLRPVKLPVDRGEPVRISVPALASGAAEAGELLAYLDRPLVSGDAAAAPAPKGLVVVLHGLGGSSRREGLRRLSISLQGAGFAVLRLNFAWCRSWPPLGGGDLRRRLQQ